MAILKGIYPREPPKYGAGRTLYMTKDLKFMMHDPIINKLREQKAWKLKLRKYKSRKLYDKVKILLQNKPKYSLLHLIKERYPTFMDALKDLDDAITMINLFSLMPSQIIPTSTLSSK